MTEADLYNVLLVALVASPANLPEYRYPDGLRSAAVRFAVGAGMCGAEELWSGYDTHGSVRWVRENLRLAYRPLASDVNRMPPYELVVGMLLANRAFARQCSAWLHIRPDCQRVIALAREENDDIYDLLQRIQYMRYAGVSESSLRSQLAEIRDRWPRYYYCPGMIPSIPKWVHEER